MHSFVIESSSKSWRRLRLCGYNGYNSTVCYVCGSDISFLPKRTSTTSASDGSGHMTTTAGIQLQPLGSREQQRRQRGVMMTAQHG